MASYVFLQRRRRRAIRRNRVFRDRTHPLEVFNDDKLLKKFRFDRQAILDLTDSVNFEVDHPLPRQGSLTPVLQVLLTLRFYATGAFQDVISGIIGVSQPTTCRTIARVTDALCQQVHRWIKMPNQQEADRNKVKFFAMRGFPNVIGCIDGTHVKIQGPNELEHEFVNRKGFHSINVQVVCDADLLFINVIAKWPGSVHDSRMLRESPLFVAFEGNRPPLKGVILGDSGYMLRTWLMTPLINPTTREERHYNFAHSSTRTTVERCIGVAKQRWHCLRSCLRLQPRKACKVILVCFMLHNRARHLKIPPPPADSSDSDSSSSDEDAGNSDDDTANHPTMTERARLSAGKTVRNRLINECF